MAEQKVLVVDDDTAICKVVSRVVQSNGLKPYVAVSGEMALDLLQREDFALVILDIKLVPNGMDGFEVLERVRGALRDLPVIILSGTDEVHDKLYGLEIGADDYVTKPFDPIFLGAKMKALLRRAQRSQKMADVMTSGDIEYHPSTMKLYVRGSEVALSTKEHALLRVFLENKGRVFTKEQLYEMIWGETIVDENAIMVYISRLRSKIEANPKNPVHILTVWGTGYKFVD